MKACFIDSNNENLKKNKKMDEGDAKTELADERVQFIKYYVEKLANIPAEQFNKMMSNVDNRENVMSFLNNDDNVKLLFGGIGALTPHLNTFPSVSAAVKEPTGTIVYFFRRLPQTPITPENIRNVLMVGSCSENAIKSIATFTDEIMVPIFMNPLNQKGWPKTLVRDFHHQLQELRDNIAETIGTMNNQTNLPLPITINEVMRIAPDILEGNMNKWTFDIKESLESSVIRWSRSIMSIVQQQSYDVLKKRKNATPNDEAKWWSVRLLNLKNIFQQLTSNEIKTIAMILQQTDSIYLSQFQRCIVTVTEAYDEASHFDLFLKPLDKVLQKFEAVDFSRCRYLLRPLMQTIILIWSRLFSFIIII